MFDNVWNVINSNESIININDAILSNRKIEDKDEFLHPSLDNLYDPFSINEMEITVNRIVNAIYDMEKIVVYGDYDVDGITSTTMLIKFIREFTYNITYFIPNRDKHGYGLTKSAIDEVLKEKPDLLITVDCGILAFDEVELLNKNNIDVIITDHHKANEMLPNAFSVLCNTRHDNTYKNPLLSSSGLTYKLIEAINLKMSLEKDLSEYLQLATLGLVADVVPLIGENRTLVKYGLEYLKNTKIEGLKALFSVCDIKLGEKLTPYHLGYIICPRLNAVGRMSEAKYGVELLLENSKVKANEYAKHFNDLNIKRQTQQQSIYDEVISKINSEKIYSDNVIVLANENWNHAIIGIVASKICELYNKPTILLDIKENIAKGSARSIDDFSIIDAINSCDKYLLTHGGHDKAAGISLDISNIDLFRKDINDYFEKNNTLKNKVIDIDLILKPEHITYDNITSLELLQPFGEGNKRPVFSMKNVEFSNVYKIGKNKNHLKLTTFVDGISFNCDKISDLIVERQEYDILMYPNINIWNDKETLQLIIYDFKFSHVNDIKLMACILALKNINEFKEEFIKFIANNFKKKEMVNYERQTDKINEINITRKEITYVYKYIKKNAINKIYIGKDKLDIEEYKLYLSLNILKELKIIDFRIRGIINFTEIVMYNNKEQLINSKIYKIFSKGNNG